MPSPKLQKLHSFVKLAYTSSPQEFAHWSWENHLQVVAKKAQELSAQFSANEELAVAGALLHDFGDAFVHRHSSDHQQISETQVKLVMQSSGYTTDEINIILNQIIKPHSCKNGLLPSTLEGKVVATADALTHLETDFYLQFVWMHLPEGLSYQQYLIWVNEKLDRDFSVKIFFDEIRLKIKDRYTALKEVYKN